MNRDLTEGNVTKSLLMFAGPMILGNLLQQCYNIADTWVVGKYVGAQALAAVGSSYALMTFLNSLLIGLCMG
ncbi:MAG: oligosaccharide flippase family protein, partial [Lachnospiraceae bacterium]|nr:oligosaccharide flippase family protein [Lachnospiraceae bacterium]